MIVKTDGGTYNRFLWSKNILYEEVGKSIFPIQEGFFYINILPNYFTLHLTSMLANILFAPTFFIRSKYSINGIRKLQGLEHWTRGKYHMLCMRPGSGRKGA